MGDELEQQLAGKTLDDIRHALPCSHPIQIELNKLEQAHRDAAEEAAKAHKRGWEQAKAAAKLLSFSCSCHKAIAKMEYGGKAND